MVYMVYMVYIIYYNGNNGLISYVIWFTNSRRFMYPQLSPASFAVVREAFSRIGWDSELTEVSEGGQCKVSGRQLQVRTTYHV